MFTALAVGLGLTANVMAQNNCNLINSATFSVPNSSVTKSFGHVPYVIDTSNPFYMPLDISQWQYIAITKGANNQAKIFKNGQLVFQGSYSNVSYNWSRLDLGAVFYTSYNGWFNGAIDEVRVSNTVRSESQILNYYSSGLPFNSDANTIGLWHFDQSSGTTINATTGTNGNISNAIWDSQGKFGQCLSYNGTNSRAQINQSIPTTNMTFEFWIKPNVIQNSSWPISWYGMNTAGFTTNQDVITKTYTWSTGATGNSITVDPTNLQYLWVSDGSCKDTIWFNSQSATIYDTVTTNLTVYDTITTNVTIYDTITTNVYDTLLTTVTDTLIINTTLSLPSPNNENTIKIYPNPARDHITIDNGNFTAMVGYSIKITNNAGQQVFQNAINQAQFNVDLSTWSGNGLYFVHLIDSQNNTVTIRKIVLQ